MITQDDIGRLYDADAYSRDGDKVGSAGQVYLDNDTGSPEWVSVHTGLFGTSQSFVPLQGAYLTEDRLQVAFGERQIKDAPRTETDGQLSAADVNELYTYYGLSTADSSYQQSANYEQSSTASGYGTADRSGDDAMTRSEERLVAGTQSEQIGTARLRKHVVTEQQQISVPVSHEEVRLEREPITDANRAAAMDGPDITENEYEVTLHAERPVVGTETVAVERVRLGTETVRDQETVTGTVRKEQIEFDDGTTHRRDTV